MKKTAYELRNADLTVANLESPLTSGCQATQEGMSFCGDQRNVEGLKYAGIDVVSLANNHAGNKGLDGIYQTKMLLDNNGIFVTGIDGPTYLKIKDKKIAFLGYNDIGYPEEGLSWAYNDKITKEVKEAKNNSDLVIIFFHWGTEYTHQPTLRQQELAYLSIDAGADLVLGNHPHWVQPVEIYKEKVITYAHGNFIFDQMWSEKTREGVLGKYTISLTENSAQITNVEFIPIIIEDYGQPHIVEGEKKDQILKEIQLNKKIDYIK